MEENVAEFYYCPDCGANIAVLDTSTKYECSKCRKVFNSIFELKKVNVPVAGGEEEEDSVK